MMITRRRVRLALVVGLLLAAVLVATAQVTVTPGRFAIPDGAVVGSLTSAKLWLGCKSSACAGIANNGGLIEARFGDDSGRTALLGQLWNTDIGTKPTCNATNRGRIWHDFNGVSVKDTVEVCAKDATDVYAWRVIY